MNVRARGRKHHSHPAVARPFVVETWTAIEHLGSESVCDVGVFETESVTLTVMDGESTSAFGESGSEEMRSGVVGVGRQTASGLSLGLSHDCACRRRGGLYP